MAVTINSNGTITGIAAGGLPDGVVDTDTLAADAVTAAKLADAVVNSEHLVSGGVDDAHLATGITSSKLSGNLPALNGASLTNLPASGVADMYMTTHFSRDMTAASGTQDITGFGFDPTHMYLYIAVEGRKECCFGQYGDGRQRSFSTTEANNQHLSTGNVIRLYTIYSGTNQHGSISFITDGFRITWTKNGSPTGTAYGWSTGWRAV